MIKKIVHNKLFKDSFIYVFADVINKAIPFLLLPVLTHYLSPADYGTLATFNSLVAMLAIFIGLSVQGAISVNYYKMEKKELAEYIGNVIYLLLVSFIITLIFLLIFNKIILVKLDLAYQWVFIAAIMSFASFMVIINLSLWIVEQKPKNYGGFQIFETILKLGLSLFFVIIMSMTWKGRVLGMFIGGLITALISVFLLYKRDYLVLKFNKKYIKDALHFGIPLIPHQLSFWLRSGAVIFLLVYLVGKKDTGLYNVGMQFVLPLAVLTAAFNKAWAPYLYRKLSENPNKEQKIRIVKFTYLYFIGILLLALALSYLAPILIKFILDQKFSDAGIYIFYLALAAAFQGMYLMVVNYIFYEKKTKYLAYITFFSSIVNIGLAYFFIKTNGALGAAKAYMLTSLLIFVLVWYYSNKVYAMPWKMN